MKNYTCKNAQSAILCALLMVVYVICSFSAFSLSINAEEVAQPEVIVLTRREKQRLFGNKAPMATNLSKDEIAERELLRGIVSAEVFSYYSTEDVIPIVEVIRNRVNSKVFPDTYTEVLTQKGQFETYSNGTYLTAEKTKEQSKAIETVLRDDYIPSMPENILFFCSQDYYDSCSQNDFFKSDSLYVYTTVRDVVYFGLKPGCEW